MRSTIAAITAAFLMVAHGARAQDPPSSSDLVLEAIWREGIEQSRVAELAQVLLDSLGPRLTGSPGSEAAANWVIDTYRSWGIEARSEPYGTWMGWRRGTSHLDLVEPRVRTLEATMLAWSPGTQGPVRGSVVALPHLAGTQALANFLVGVRGQFVLLTAPEPSCRPEDNWEQWATPESLARHQLDLDSTRADWIGRAQSTGVTSLGEIAEMLEGAGAAGILSSEWSRGWGVDKVFAAETQAIPQVDVSCEDYGLLWRLAVRGQGPVVRLEAEAEPLGEVPVANTIGVILGSELPDEYVLLSAHFDSWDGASGATDNGSGTVLMMEVMRILRRVYPRPKRTIMVGHWNGEEQGLNGSRAFAEDHPEIVSGLQVLLNHDDGTGRIDRITMEGIVGAGAYFSVWLENIPEELTRGITLADPGMPGRGMTDSWSFICAGAPAFGMNSTGWDYGVYTWHTNRDTYDKLVTHDLRANATLTAMLAYLASEEPDRIPRTRRELPIEARTGVPATWPECTNPDRSFVR
jgi:carboxypeptidase Q